MRFIKQFVILSLSLSMGTCVIADNGELDIDIGYYENHLEAWISQNILDYQIKVTHFKHNPVKRGVVIVKNGIPESSDPPTWLERGYKSTVMDFFSFIKEEEKRLRDTFDGKNDCRLEVRYNREYHYPRRIFLSGEDWEITLTLLKEEDQTSEIGEE